jgi:hypothetical protein
MAEVPEKLLRAVNTANLMTPRQREIVTRDIRTLERALHGEAMPYFGGDPTAQGYQPAPGRLDAPPAGHVRVMREMPVPDREDLERNHKSCLETLAAGAAPDLSTAAKNVLYAQYKRDWEAYQEGMPSHEQMWRPQWQNVQLHLKHKAANVARAKRLQNIHRILEPEDDVFHLEALRPEKPTPYNGAAFRAGYDHIQWSDDKELEMQMAELDDATYYEFLQLRAAGITSRKIFEDKLAISRQQYEACEARLKASALGSLDPAPAGPDDEDDDESEDDDETGQVPTTRPLSEKAQAALDAYGGVLLTIAEDGPLDVNGAAAVLQQVAPDVFTNVLRARGKAQVALKALAKTGQLVRIDKLYYTQGNTPA